MVASMTAFARGVFKTEHGDITFELKSVNHRYLEPHFRLQESFRPHEVDFRQILKANLARGKIDVNLSFEPCSDESPNMEVNVALVKSIQNAAKAVGEAIGKEGSLDVKTLLRWPGVLSSTNADLDILGEAAQSGLKETVKQLIENRQREGAKLVEQIELRLVEITNHVAKAREIYPNIQSLARETLMKKLTEALERVDNDRVEQELVHLAQRMDVAEELDRLEVHVSETHTILKKGGSVGRRLDFIMQEFNREANTLGSKSQDKELTKIAVELKVLIEQVREQIQNIE